ncbi:two-component system response regulator [Pseudoalteromonas citrea]|uniref:Two-component system response regulator n=1 Tax=Pseudoalteromonas citrea TaxID=43655 RepID=A0A5S3XG64_9GAMM|nr:MULTISPECIES: response regulator [Pseudoalteromonas]RJE73849.1 two-component system response regulator [Pseudoalteromonas sp. MSK9-3]TMP41694.1 two-component system response regulator [Pseudoalteromonas citrea]TMP51344.1 two-component system response regulator [Pseudoalteromonas citrea]
MNELLSADLAILLIEPSATQRKIIAKELQEEGISNIDFADSLESAKTMLATSIPDLVISSMYFSDGTAQELQAYINTELSEHGVPFMLVSSETRKAELEIFKQSGVIAILPKPFNKVHLGRAINATLDILAPQELELDLYDVHDLRILIVDDSRLARNHIRRVLTNLGAQRFCEAEDGAHALKILQEHMFDLIVTDYNMPSVNGQELTETIRNSDEHAHIPVLMVTSEANDTHLANIAQSGVNAMCDKPFEPDTVKKLIYQLLDQD